MADTPMDFGYWEDAGGFIGSHAIVIMSQHDSVLDAAILGWIIYGVFETTNAAIFKDWDLFSIIVDTTWGGILYALTTFIYNKIFN